MRKVLFFIIVILSAIFINGCLTENKRVYSFEEINNPKQITLPINSAFEVIQYSFSLDDVKKELNKKDELIKYDGWYIRATKLKKYPQNDEKYKNVDIWAVLFMNGAGECLASYGCQIEVTSNGEIVRNIQCDNGWNCK